MVSAVPGDQLPGCVHTPRVVLLLTSKLLHCPVWLLAPPTSVWPALNYTPWTTYTVCLS